MAQQDGAPAPRHEGAMEHLVVPHIATHVPRCRGPLDPRNGAAHLLPVGVGRLRRGYGGLPLEQRPQPIRVTHLGRGDRAHAGAAMGRRLHVAQRLELAESFAHRPLARVKLGRELQLEQAGIELSVWRIHRRIGMSGGLFVNALLREIGRKVTAEQVARILQLHGDAYARLVAQVRPLPGARDLLAYLSRLGVPWAIATSGLLESARPALEMLGAGPEVPVITRDQVRHAKPDPDLFLAAAARLGADVRASVVVGDSVWDLLAARRARALGVGLLSGGYGAEELERAGAYRVYQDPADLLKHLDEVGVRIAE